MAMLGALTLIMVLVPTIPLIGQLSDDVDPSVMRQIGELKTSWQQLENDVTSGRLSSADSFQRHSQLIEQIVQETLNQVLDSSGLSYDPVAESYHLIIAGLQNAPRLMEEIAKVQGDILATSTAQSPSSDDSPAHSFPRQVLLCQKPHQPSMP